MKKDKEKKWKLLKERQQNKMVTWPQNMIFAKTSRVPYLRKVQKKKLGIIPSFICCFRTHFT